MTSLSTCFQSAVLFCFVVSNQMRNNGVGDQLLMVLLVLPLKLPIVFVTSGDFSANNFTSCMCHLLYFGMLASTLHAYLRL